MVPYIHQWKRFSLYNFAKGHPWPLYFSVITMTCWLQLLPGVFNILLFCNGCPAYPEEQFLLTKCVDTPGFSRLLDNIAPGRSDEGARFRYRLNNYVTLLVQFSRGAGYHLPLVIPVSIIASCASHSS